MKTANMVLRVVLAGGLVCGLFSSPGFAGDILCPDGSKAQETCPSGETCRCDCTGTNPQAQCRCEPPGATKKAPAAMEGERDQLSPGSMAEEDHK
jgi:hypothetical protein